MNDDFSDLESQLKGLRPMPLRESFVARMEQAMADPAVAGNTPNNNIIRPPQFRQWIIGLSLAAAAAVLLLVRVNFRPPETSNKLASASPQPATAPVQPTRGTVPNTFLPTGATQVVYHQRDEGLLFAKNDEEPVRRLRSLTRETLHWRNPATGASIEVSYPSEQVELVPISAQ